jgi:hypothetical protein
MTLEQAQAQLKQRIQEAQDRASTKTVETIIALSENDAYIETQRSLMSKDTELKRLDSIINQLNAIKPFQAKSGDKFSINVFPINTFDTGLDRILGIIAGSRSAFVDELSLQYEAITGISMIELTLARQALGQPAYFSKGEIVDEVPADLSSLNNYLKSIALKLNVVEFDTNVSKSALALYFVKGRIKAETAKASFDKSATLDATSSFTLED